MQQLVGYGAMAAMVTEASMERTKVVNGAPLAGPTPSLSAATPGPGSGRLHGLGLASSRH